MYVTKSPTIAQHIREVKYPQ